MTRAVTKRVSKSNITGHFITSSAPGRRSQKQAPTFLDPDPRVREGMDLVEGQERDGKSIGCRAVLGSPRSGIWHYCQSPIDEKSPSYCSDHLNRFMNKDHVKRVGTNYNRR